MDIFSVTVEIDAAWPDDTRVEPRTVEFDRLDDAMGAVRRATENCPTNLTTVMVARESVSDAEWRDSADEPDLVDWPAQRHIVTGGR